MAEAHRDEITKLEALYSDNPEGRVFTLLAEAYRKAGELDHAREVLEGGIKRHSSYASAYVVLGRVLLDQQQGPAAEDAFRRVLELDPENLVALRALGDRARTTGRHQDALKYYRELLMLDPSDEELQQTVASLEQDVGAGAQPVAATSAPVDLGGWTAPAPGAGASRESQIAASGDFGNISIDSSAESNLPADANYGDISMQSGSGNMLSLDSDADLGGSFSLDSADSAFTGLGGELTGGLGSMDLSGGGDMSGGDFGELPDFGGLSLDSASDFGTMSDAPAGGLGEDVGLPPMSFEPLEEASVGAGELPMLDAPPTEAIPAEELSWSPDPVDMLETPLPGESPADQGFRPFAPQEPAAAAGLPFTNDGLVEETAPAMQGWSPEQVEDELPAPAPLPGEDAFGPLTGDGDQAPWATAAEPAEGELATETMAELYMTQGLHARAVEVYRALLRERPDDERLYTKLRLAEFAVSSALAPRQEPAEQEEPESAWTAAPSTAGQEQTPYAWAHEEEPDTGPQIGQYLSALLGWRSSTPRPARAQPARPAPAPALADVDTHRQSAEQAAAEAETDLSWLDDPAPAARPEAAQPAAPAAAAPKPAASAQPAPAAAANEDDLAWLFEDEPPQAAAAPAPASGAPAPGQDNGGGNEGEGGDDDDLEMFRAWLQSLKR